jgi:hypothetical protein
MSYVGNHVKIQNKNLSKNIIIIKEEISQINLDLISKKISELKKDRLIKIRENLRIKLKDFELEFSENLERLREEDEINSIQISSEDLIKENLERAQRGEPLTTSLSKLGPKFKLEYMKITNSRVPLHQAPRRSWETTRHHGNFKKFCFVCENEFITNNFKKIVCSKKCSKEYSLVISRGYKREYSKRPEVIERRKKRKMFTGFLRLPGDISEYIRNFGKFDKNI